MRTVTFAAGLAAGYVLGTKAGREKYEQISAAARRLGDQPLVNQTQTALKGLAQNTGQAAASKIASLTPDKDKGEKADYAANTAGTEKPEPTTATPANMAGARSTETQSAPPPTPTPQETKAGAGASGGSKR